MATSASPPPTPGASGSAAASKVFLMVAVLLGVLATMLAFYFINNAGASNTGPQGWIVVANRDLSPNTVLDPARDLRVDKIPLQFSKLAVKCLDYKSLSLYKGERINREIMADTPVFLGDIANISMGELILEKPYRALTIPLKNIGMVIPGDYVKIVLPPKPGYSSATTEPTLLNPGVLSNDAQIIGRDEGFKVLAVSGMLRRTRPQALASDQTGAGNANQNVTLQVTEAQAKEIIGAFWASTSSNNAYLLLCPSANTAAPAAPGETASPASTPARGSGDRL